MTQFIDNRGPVVECESKIMDLFQGLVIFPCKTFGIRMTHEFMSKYLCFTRYVVDQRQIVNDFMAARSHIDRLIE